MQEHVSQLNDIQFKVLQNENIKNVLQLRSNG